MQIVSLPLRHDKSSQQIITKHQDISASSILDDRKDGNQDQTAWKLKVKNQNDVFQEFSNSPFLLACVIGVGILFIMVIIIILVAINFFVKKKKTDKENSVETGSDEDIPPPPPANIVP